MASRGKDTVARKQPEQTDEADQRPADNDADWPVGFPGRGETENKPNFYRELGLKEGATQQAVGVEKFKNEPPEQDMVDKSDASEHQAEGPGGKG
jgi:hypothetical protein